MRIYWLITFTILVALGSCVSSNLQDLDPMDCITENSTYAEDIIPIIDKRCYECHDAASNLGDVTLEGYSNLKVYVDNGELLGTIKRESGYNPMPKDRGSLSNCEIDIIEAWINDGAQDN